MNTTLIHDLITRQIDLMRYEASVRQSMFSLLDTLHNDVAARLVSGSLNIAGCFFIARRSDDRGRFCGGSRFFYGVNE